MLRDWHWNWSTFYYYRKHFSYLYAVYKTHRKLLRYIFNIIFFVIFLNKDQRLKNFASASGLINAMLGKKSWYRFKSSDQEN